MCALLCLLVLVLLAPAPASAGSLFFDFEDGTTQGWELIFNTSLQDATAVGGQYAVFGTDGGSMGITLDVTNIEALTLEALYTGPDASLAEHFLFVLASIPGDIEVRTAVAVPDPDRDIRSFDLSELVGEWNIRISWNSLDCPGGCPLSLDVLTGYIDNIRFVPVPEASAATGLVTAFGVLRASGGGGPQTHRDLRSHADSWFCCRWRCRRGCRGATPSSGFRLTGPAGAAPSRVAPKPGRSMC